MRFLEDCPKGAEDRVESPSTSCGVSTRGQRASTLELSPPSLSGRDVEETAAHRTTDASLRPAQRRASRGPSLPPHRRAQRTPWTSMRRTSRRSSPPSRRPSRCVSHLLSALPASPHALQRHLTLWPELRLHVLRHGDDRTQPRLRSTHPLRVALLALPARSCAHHHLYHKSSLLNVLTVGL